MSGTKTEIAPGVWRLRVFVGRNANGSPVQRSKTIRVPDKNPKPGAGSRLADVELAKMVAEASRGRAATGSETVGDLLDSFLQHLGTLDRSPTTMKEYRRIIESILRPELGRIKLSKLTARDLDALYARLTERGLSPASVHRVHALIGVALHQAERWDLVDRNVARRATPPTERVAEIVTPTPEEVRRIVDVAEAVEPTLASMLLVAALTGARRGELCALRWSDLDAGDGTLRIARSVYKTADGGWADKSTKTHASRRVSLDELGLEVLRLHRSRVGALASELGVDLGRDAFMFSRSPAGVEPIQPDVVTGFLKRVADKAGVSTHLHALRHFSATQAISAGFDPVTVAARLGHADPSITLRVYSHAVAQRDRELAASLSRSLGLLAPARDPELPETVTIVD